MNKRKSTFCEALTIIITIIGLSLQSEKPDLLWKSRFSVYMSSYDLIWIRKPFYRPSRNFVCETSITVTEYEPISVFTYAWRLQPLSYTFIFWLHWQFSVRVLVPLLQQWYFCISQWSVSGRETCFCTCIIISQSYSGLYGLSSSASSRRSGSISSTFLAYTPHLIA
jgi:hypothetical protein